MHLVKRFLKKPIHLALVESSLELVPREIQNHPVVVKNALKRGRKPSEVLLDTSIHYHAMHRLRDRFKRGRPDIVHVSLLEALDSPLNIEGYLRTYIHTINNHVIFIKPDTRIPRNYNRFVGLMEQLLVKGKAPPDSDEPLLYVKTMKIIDLARELDLDGYILLREKGRKTSIEDLAKTVSENNLMICIGGFPHGDYNEETIENSVGEYSIYDKPLKTWIVVSRIITTIEKHYNILK